MGYVVTTNRGYSLMEVVSAMQKAIRRGDARIAGYFAIELFESGYEAYMWRRLLIISAEDCADVITQEIKSLYDSYEIICKKNKNKDGRRPERVFAAKAVIILSKAIKSRDADHLCHLVYAKKETDDERILSFIDEIRKEQGVKIPEYSFDVHTLKGRYLGKTKDDFLIDEHNALVPRQAGLFDEDVEALARNKN